jgi:hypothetical protein
MPNHNSKHLSLTKLHPFNREYFFQNLIADLKYVVSINTLTIEQLKTKITSFEETWGHWFCFYYWILHESAIELFELALTFYQGVRKLSIKSFINPDWRRSNPVLWLLEFNEYLNFQPNLN